MGHTWYLAVDVQFYCFAPLLLVPLVRFPRLGLRLMGTTFLAHLMVTAYICSANNLPPSLWHSLSSEDGDDYHSLYYIKPWTRIGPYLVGTFFGHLYVNCQKISLTMRKPFLCFAWASTTLSGGLVLFGLYGREKISLTASTVYNIFHTSIWAVWIDWIIFACATGYGGTHMATILGGRVRAIRVV
ncbi:hypothetical protein BV898_03406 [Hypsibius exemplaris]|uniref:Nose resistant to fluoxetine protein 6 n=1 Tax=Hypsibius exemplaris TaxID=2072580 RepID=A0A1W0X5G3_HYPEX|nr:hypothetical protein BV898_03406 [Hypsibius exemplaris]